jgi:hypothetical protein
MSNSNYGVQLFSIPVFKLLSYYPQPQGSHSDQQEPAGPFHRLPMDHKNDEQWSYADHLVQIACGVS